jgi:hypothetical protein
MVMADLLESLKGALLSDGSYVQQMAEPDRARRYGFPRPGPSSGRSAARDFQLNLG